MLRRALFLSPLLIATQSIAQDRLPSMAGYDRFTKATQEAPNAVKGGIVRIKWLPDGNSFVYAKDGKYFKYDLYTRLSKPAEQTNVEPITEGGARSGPLRGRQFDTVPSPNGKYKAMSRNRNVLVSGPSGEVPVTKDGSTASRIKYGTASWVYGEELSQIDAMWWSPDSKKLAYYRFDESKVKDYYLALNQLKFQDTLDVEPFPKPGQPNPVADLYVYDVATKKSVHVDGRFDSGYDRDLGHYVYNVTWSPDGKSLLFFRMNRLQNQQELVAADPATGECRLVFHRTNPDGWLEPKTTGEYPSTNPDLWWLKNGSKNTRFLYISDESGFRNLNLYDLMTGFVRHVTQNKFDVRTILRIDPESSTVWYSAQGDKNPYLTQLHRVQIDGSGDTVLTDPAFSHLTSVSPTGTGFVDIAQTLETPPSTRVCDKDGKVLETIATSDLGKFNELGLKKAERFICKAADGVTDIYGYLMKPSNFDPSKKYPLLVNVYGGPDFGDQDEDFLTPDPITELGFVVAWIDGRGSGARGVAFKEAVYHKFGVVEIDDQAAGARYLSELPYVDGTRIGIFGTSYGGYASLMAILRYPDLFKAAAISSPVTDWRNYDTIYTERYMGLLNQQTEAYDRGSALPLAKDLKGNILLYFGTSDNNVHPSHTITFVNELDKAHKSYELALGPDLEHTDVNRARMMEFFIDHLGQAKP